VTHKILCETCVKKLKIKSDFTHELKTTSDWSFLEKLRRKTTSNWSIYRKIFYYNNYQSNNFWK
jgi:hypothetical protein